MSVSEKILTILEPVYRNVLESPDLVVTRELSAHDVETWDSLNHITLIVEIEMLSGLEFVTDELIDLQNVGDFVDLMISKGYSPQ